MFHRDIVKMICSLKCLCCCRLQALQCAGSRGAALAITLLSFLLCSRAAAAACSLLAMTLQLQDHCSSAVLQLTTITQHSRSSAASTADNCNLNICTAPLSIVISNGEAD